jgi:hypothetical protein
VRLEPRATGAAKPETDFLPLLGGGRHDVAGGGGEAGAFELDGGVADVEVGGGFGLYGVQDALAFVHVHVGDAGVEAEGVVAVAERPDVDVVNFEDAVDGEDGAGYVFDAAIGWAALEQDVGGFAQDSDAGPENEQTDGETEERIDPADAGRADDDGADDDGDIGERVTEIVNQDAAEIQVVAAADKSKRDAAVDGESGEGSPDHPALDDFYRRAEALDRFVTQPE